MGPVRMGRLRMGRTRRVPRAPPQAWHGHRSITAESQSCNNASSCIDTIGALWSYGKPNGRTDIPMALAPVTSNTHAFAAEWAPRLLSVLRIVAALLFLEHGTQKLLGFPPLASGAGPAMMTLPWIAGLIELVGGLLLLLDLFSRPVAFVMSGEMAFAYWIAHFPRNPFPVLNGGDAAILYCFVFLYIAAAGPGPWSIDASRSRNTF